MSSSGDRDIQALKALIHTLRSEDGCPWDRKQTSASMAVYLTEEVFELYDAILDDDTGAIVEEMGDVLFQLMFVLMLYEEQGRFDLGEVVARNIAKMKRRHPHVFGDQRAATPEAVRRQWNDIKKSEKASSHDASMLDSVPRHLPALIRAYRISQRAADAGFDWADIGGVLDKVDEEWAEFTDELKKGPDGRKDDRLGMEFGDVLFTLVNVARFARIHPETALAGSAQKFEKRFRRMEAEAARRGQTIDDLDMAALDRLWEWAKSQEG